MFLLKYSIGFLLLFSTSEAFTTEEQPKFDLSIVTYNSEHFDCSDQSDTIDQFKWPDCDLDREKLSEIETNVCKVDELFQSDTPANAILLLADLFKRVPCQGEYYTVLINLFERMDSTGQKLMLLDRVLKMFPNSTNLLILRGGAFGSLKDFDKAIADFDKAIELSPEKCDLYEYYTADILAKLNNSELNKRVMSKMALFCNDKYLFSTIYGMLLFNTKQYEDALKYFKDADQIDPNNPDSLIVRTNIGMLLVETGKPEQAVDYLLTLLIQNPDNLIIRMQLAGAYGAMGDSVNMEKQLDEITKRGGKFELKADSD